MGCRDDELSRELLGLAMMPLRMLVGNTAGGNSSSTTGVVANGEFTVNGPTAAVSGLEGSNGQRTQALDADRDGRREASARATATTTATEAGPARLQSPPKAARAAAAAAAAAVAAPPPEAPPANCASCKMSLGPKRLCCELCQYYVCKSCHYRKGIVRRARGVVCVIDVWHAVDVKLVSAVAMSRCR